MATSIRQFNTDLYREHVDEASFVHDQRLAYLRDPEVSWLELRDWEERFEAHVDALVVGRDLALEICRQADAGDAGAVGVALSVLCRRDRKDDVFAMIESLDAQNEEVQLAAANALCREAPSRWQHDLAAALEDRRDFTSVWARVIGFRRFPMADALHGALVSVMTDAQREVAWALGRVGSTSSAPRLNALLDAEDDRVCEAAAIAMLRLGDARPIQCALTAAEERPWACRVLGIAGDPRAVPVLLNVVRHEPVSRDAILAIGLIGHLSAVAPLLELLEHDELKQPAAVALNVITGADLFANVFTPDEVDPDELFDDERDAYVRDGTLPVTAGKPYGTWARQPLLDRDSWRSWLEQNKHQFTRDLRWRRGEPYGPVALCNCLRSETSPYAIRHASCEELVLRYGLDIPFEVDLRVDQQLRFLPKIATWARSQDGRVEKGRWYFAGQLQA